MTETEAKASAAAFTVGKKGPSAPAGTPVNTVDPTKVSAHKIIANAPFRIEAVQSRDRWFKACFYGNHGVGKTELAGTAVDVDFMRDVILIDLEKGQRTIQETPRIENKDLIDRIEVSSFKQTAQVYDFLKAHCKFRDEDNEKALRVLQSQTFGVLDSEIDRVRRYRTAIIDSATELDLYSMQEVMKQDDVAKVLAGDTEVADWPIFRKNSDRVKMLLRAFRDLPMHLIFLCQRRFSQDERKQYHYNPGITGQLSGALQSYVDMVGYLRVEEATPDNPMPRRLYVQPVSGAGGRFDAKNRRASFTGSWFDNPSMSLIMTGIGVSKTESVDPEKVRNPEAD